MSGFIIVTETLQQDFDNFKSTLPHAEFSRLEVSPLLQYWNDFVRPSSGIPITLFGKQYLELHFSEVDSLCQWVLDTRAEHEKGFKIGSQMGTNSVKGADDTIREGESSAETPVLTVSDAQAKRKVMSGDACRKRSNGPVIDLTNCLPTKERKLWTVAGGMALYEDDR